MKFVILLTICLGLIFSSFQQESYLLDSYCAWNEASAHVDIILGPELMQKICSLQTNPESCGFPGFCWWRNTTNQNNLANHQLTFKPATIYNVAPGVYVANGFDLANCILIINNGEAVIIDTLSSVPSATAAIAAFEEYLGGPIPPIVAVIYTHSHLDHFGGTKAFTLAPGTPIYAQATFLTNFANFEAASGAIVPRTVDQFAFYLQIEEGENVNGFLGDGIGPLAYFSLATPTFPNTFFLNALNVTLAGLDFNLIYTPGETDDTIAIYLPSLNVACVGDNVYRSFSNLYAIRGTPPRDAKVWYESIDTVRSLNPSVVIGSHTQPITEDTADTLTNYRDAIQYVHDQTLLLINEGLDPDDIAASIQLPDYLASEPYLQQFYGYIPWCAKSIFTTYIGWFSGSIADLNVMTTTEQAQRLVALAGGEDAILYKAYNALNEGTLTGAMWALELATNINRTITTSSKNYPFVYDIFVQAAQEIAFAQPSTNGRNFILQVVADLTPPPPSNVNENAAPQEKKNKLADQEIALLMRSPIKMFLGQLKLRMNYKKSKEIKMCARASIDLRDEELIMYGETKIEYVFAIRREILEVYPSSVPLTQRYDCSLEMHFASSFSFKSLILSYATVTQEIEKGNLDSQSPIAEIEYFFDLFQKN